MNPEDDFPVPSTTHIFIPVENKERLNGMRYAIEWFNSRYGCDPAYIIVGARTYKIMLHEWTVLYRNLPGMNTFDGIPLVLDPDSENVDKFTPVLEPYQTMLYMTKPDTVVKRENAP